MRRVLVFHFERGILWGEEALVLTFGPISVLPGYQRQGIGKMLLEYSFRKAGEMGYQAVIIFGNPANYMGRGFKSCKKYNVCAAEKFEEAFEPMEKGFSPSQEEFYIHSHSIIKG